MANQTHTSCHMGLPFGPSPPTSSACVHWHPFIFDIHLRGLGYRLRNNRNYGNRKRNYGKSSVSYFIRITDLTGFVEVAAVVFVSGLYNTKSTLFPHQNTQSYRCRIEISFF